ncbi:MAG: hypothetical protein U1F35_18780 [Steroidobacteraceae bacterium]
MASSSRCVDVQVSDWDCTLEPNEAGRPEVRLGLRMVAGLPEEQAMMLVRARVAAAFDSVEDLAHRGGLNRRALQSLAQADALRSLSGHRHAAQWSAIGVEQAPARSPAPRTANHALALPEPTEGQEIVADYRSTGLTLKRHPLEVLRHRLERLRVTRAGDLTKLPTGRSVRGRHHHPSPAARNRFRRRIHVVGG